MPDWNNITDALQSVTSLNFKPESAEMVMGGDINRSYKIAANDGSFAFVKFNERNKLNMFEAEAAGLAALAATNTVRVPEVIHFGQNDVESYLALEFLPLTKYRDEVVFGQQLAALHKHTQAQFGWHINNTIGLATQVNTPDDSWINFWINYRLKPQLNIARRNNCGAHFTKLGQDLLEKCPALFVGHKPEASLLHGDLWGGNAAGLEDGTPVIFDPACYYGDREVDLAMMELFGGYDNKCYDAYNEAYPVSDGYGIRKLFYNLYHVLNHFNLFGSGYHRQSMQMIEKLLAEV